MHESAGYTCRLLFAHFLLSFSLFRHTLVVFGLKKWGRPSKWWAWRSGRVEERLLACLFVCLATYFYVHIHLRLPDCLPR